MNNFLTYLPTILEVGSIVSIILAGIFYFLGIFGNKQSGDLKQAEKNNDYIIKSFKEKIEVLEGKVAEQATAISSMLKKLDQLSTENITLRDLLQGRDTKTQEFQTMGFEIMTKTVPLLLDMTTKTNRNVERLAKAIEQHLTQMENKQMVTTVTTGLISEQKV